ncbi:MAG: polysaccharide biosynthesis tyrosine autokinase [Cyanobacteria bacterium P01_A01_bin.45]
MESKESFSSLGKFYLILKRRWPPATAVFLLFFSLSVFGLSSRKSTYVAEGKLRFQRVNATSTLTGVGGDIGKLEPLVAQKSNPLNTEAQVITSTPVIKQTISKLNLKGTDKSPLSAEAFRSKLLVKDIKTTDVLTISYQDEDPETAAEVVNALMDIYINENITAQREQAVSARKFLEKQLPKTEMQVRKLEAELRKFKEDNQIFDLQLEASKSLELISSLQGRINEVRAKISNINTEYQHLRKQLNMDTQQAVVMTTLTQSEGVQNVVKRIQELESKLALDKVRFLDTHPDIISSENQLQALREILQQRISKVPGSGFVRPEETIQMGELQQNLSSRLVELESNRLAMASELATLTSLYSGHKQRLEILPKLEQRNRELEEKLKTVQATYSLLSQKLQESRIAQSQGIGNVRVISPAVVPGKSTSSAAISYMSATLLGIIASLMAIYLLEAKDKSLKTVDEAKELIGLTLLGLIPSISNSRKSIINNSSDEFEEPSSRLVVRDMPRSPISEAYRMLRANLKFMNADRESKVIVVTSSVPKEGKSTVAANLATSMGQMESKVLLIDADLHRPIQHKMWEISNNQGLSNVIVGEVEVMRAIQKVENNLDILTSGVVPPSPASLLDSKRMASLIDSFANYYDYVIIDAPSLNLAADAATLGQMADGVLLVVRPGVVDSVNAVLAKEILENSGQNVLGQVVNGVIPENESHSYYYFEQEYDSQESSTIKNLMNHLNNLV